MLEDNKFWIFQTRFFGLPAPTLIVHIDPLVSSQSDFLHLEQDMGFLKTSSSIATRTINKIHTAPIFSHFLGFLVPNCLDSPDIIAVGESVCSEVRKAALIKRFRRTLIALLYSVV